MSATIALLLCLGTVVLSAEVNKAVEKLVGDDPSWNYVNHGTDWDFLNCSDTSLWQSPWPLTTDTSFVWSELGQLSFLTAWQEAQITDYGVTNYTYRMNITDGALGTFYAVEPFPASIQIWWEPYQIRFKYPSEHSIDGVSYDMEMQIVMNDTLQRSVWCKEYKAALTIMFSIGTEDSEFLDWVGTENPTINLEKVFTKTTSMTSQMWSYMGTDTEPSCNQGFCWYFPLPVQSITQETLDKLKAPGVEWNNRALSLGEEPVYKF